MSTDRIDGALDPAAEFLRALAEGKNADTDWLRRRARDRAAGQFTGWAWRWIEADFVGDLLLQLTITVGRPGFLLRGSAAAYLDISILNLCRSYFRELGARRKTEPLEGHHGLPDRSADAARRVAAALELRWLLEKASPDCRRLLLGKYAQGHSLQELAKQTGLEPKTVQSRLHTCRQRLRALWRKRRSTAGLDPTLKE